MEISYSPSFRICDTPMQLRKTRVGGLYPDGLRLARAYMFQELGGYCDYELVRAVRVVASLKKS